MIPAGFSSLLRKYWYLVLAALALLGALIYFLATSDLTPVEMLGKYGYIVILGWTFLEGETIVIIAGMLSTKIGLDPWLIALCAFCGSFASDQVMFSLGKYKGHDVLHYFPRVERNIDRAAVLFKKYDIALILGFRFVYGVRNITPIMLGISGVSHRKFLMLNFIGAGIWALSFSFGGYYAGEVFMSIMDKVGHGIFYAIIAVLAVGGGIWLLRSRRAVKHVKEVAHVDERRTTHAENTHGAESESEKKD